MDTKRDCALHPSRSSPLRGVLHELCLQALVRPEFRVLAETHILGGGMPEMLARPSDKRFARGGRERKVVVWENILS